MNTHWRINWMCIGLLACTASVALGDQADEPQWPMTRGNSASTGATASALPDSLELLWEYRLEGLGFDSGPIVADGKVFAADADGQIIALSLDRGEKLWLLKFEAGFIAAPSYHQGTLYLGDLDGVIRAIDPLAGKVQWQYDAEHEIDAGANFYQDSVLFTSQGGSLLSIDRLSGSLRWRYETADQLQCGPTLAGKLTFLGGCDQHLHIVDVETGLATTNKIPIDAPTGSTPSVSQQIVLVPNYKGQIWAFQTPSHELLWKFENGQLSSEFKNSVAVAENVVVAASGNRRLFALDLTSGEVLWEHTLRRRVEGSPVISGSKVAVAASDGRILLHDLRSGKELWSFETKGSFLGSPAVAQGRLITTSDRGTISCFGTK